MNTKTTPHTHGPRHHTDSKRNGLWTQSSRQSRGKYVERSEALKFFTDKILISLTFKHNSVNFVFRFANINRVHSEILKFFSLTFPCRGHHFPWLSRIFLKEQYMIITVYLWYLFLQSRLQLSNWRPSLCPSLRPSGSLVNAIEQKLFDLQWWNSTHGCSPRRR